MSILHMDIYELKKLAFEFMTLVLNPYSGYQAIDVKWSDRNNRLQVDRQGVQAADRSQHGDSSGVSYHSSVWSAF